MLRGVKDYAVCGTKYHHNTPDQTKLDSVNLPRLGRQETWSTEAQPEISVLIHTKMQMNVTAYTPRVTHQTLLPFQQLLRESDDTRRPSWLCRGSSPRQQAAEYCQYGLF